MSDAMYKWLVILGDFFGIFCFNVNAKHVSISRILIFANIFKIFLVVWAYWMVSFSIDAENYFAAPDLEEAQGYSPFSKVISVLVVVHEQGMGVFVIIVNLHKRKSICNFLNQVLKTPIQRKYRDILKSRLKACLGYSVVLWAFVSGFTFVSLFKLEFKSFLLFLLTMSPYFAEYSLIFLLKVFEIFFVTLLEEFRDKIKNRKSYTTKRMLKRFQLIVDTNKEFQSAFGSILTATTCGLTFTATMQVSSIF